MPHENISAAIRWADALASWAIPDRILANAPASPWVHPPKMFKSSDDDPADTPSMVAAASMLGPDASVLDVGCGGGRSSLPLGSRLRRVIGVDESPEMLEQFAASAMERQIAVETVRGRWPDVADQCQRVDVAVCHHVVYNVGDIAPFVRALSSTAHRGVVVELTNVHPQTPFNELWKRFWNLDRPVEPTAELFVEVVRELGHEPQVVSTHRPARPGRLDGSEMVAFVRQRLCMNAERDAEIREYLDARPLLSSDTTVTVSWRT